MLELCKKIIQYAANGDPVKDAIDGSNYTQDSLLEALAHEYVQARSGQVHKERADL